MTSAAQRGSIRVRASIAFAAYGLLGLPLAMSALPVYVQAPIYYASHLGLALASTGWVLFLARLFDTFQDPLIGQWIDRLGGGLHCWLMRAACLLALAFLGLWLPPVSHAHLALWLALTLIAAYTAHSMLNIAYLSWGARLQRPDAGYGGVLLDVAAWREGAGLIGVIVASVVPSLILDGPRGEVASSMAWYCVGFAIVLMLAILALLYVAPPWRRNRLTNSNWRSSYYATWYTLANNRAFRALLAPYFLNALSVSIPATLVLFFIHDRLHESAGAGVFLATYFVAAAFGLPIWVMLAKRIGVVRSWRLGILLAIVAFSDAGFLSEDDGLQYFAVCVGAGVALGADLALPPVLLAQTIANDGAPASYYGVWTLLGKLALALSGLTLPLLAHFGYRPGHPGGALLGWTYAGIPCALKFLALLFLMHVKPMKATT